MQILLVAAAFALALLPGLVWKRLYIAESERTKLIRQLLYLTAVLCGIAAMGCWVLTRSDAAFAKEQGPATLGLMMGSICVLLLAIAVSAYCARRKGGSPCILREALFLTGVCGFFALLYFVVVSRGALFGFGAFPFVLLFATVTLAALFGRQRKVLHNKKETARPVFIGTPPNRARSESGSVSTQPEFWVQCTERVLN